MEKVIDITERVPTMRKKRKRRTNIKFIFLTASFVIIILLLLYFQSSYSNIKKIEVKGYELLTEEQYIQSVGLAQGDSFWGFDQSDIEQQLTSNDWMKEAVVKRKWPNHVEIDLVEYEKVAYILQDNKFYPMLENGVIYTEANQLVPVDAPIFIAFDDESLRKKILKQLIALKPEVVAAISQISATPTQSDPYAITLFMNDGYEVRAEISTLAEKLNYYPSIIAQIEAQETFEKGIIDIEVGSYYRPFSEEYGIELQLEEGQDVSEGE